MVGMPALSKRTGLEVIRAGAALTVMASHAFLFGIFPQSTAMEMLFSYATEAVVLFFILSGVVISLNHERDVGAGYKTAQRYAIKRIVRIYPIYLVALAAGGLIVPAVKGEPFHWLEVFGNLAFLQSLGGSIVSPPAADQALWSLANEMTYYGWYEHD